MLTCKLVELQSLLLLLRVIDYGLGTLGSQLCNLRFIKLKIGSVQIGIQPENLIFCLAQLELTETLTPGRAKGCSRLLKQNFKTAF